jgi:hypothetical protein
MLVPGSGPVARRATLPGAYGAAHNRTGPRVAPGATCR